MASRQEEKEARRRERLAREAAESRAAANRRRLQLVGGGLLGLLAVAGVAVALIVGLGGSKDETVAAAPRGTTKPLPPQETSDHRAAAKAAGCTLANPRYEGADHAQKDFKPSDYKTNPPTSGAHTPDWYEDGVYEPGTTPSLGMLVHPLEHGRINVQYRPGTPKADVARLEALLQEQNEGYHMLLFENTTGMEPQVAATAWTHSLTCPRMNELVFDAIRSFRARYIDKGPEKIP